MATLTRVRKGTLQSQLLTVTAALTTIETACSKSLMPLDGDIRVWYGAFAGDATALLAQGMLITSGSLLEHVKEHDGLITVRSVTGTVTIHEVV